MKGSVKCRLCLRIHPLFVAASNGVKRQRRAATNPWPRALKLYNIYTDDAEDAQYREALKKMFPDFFYFYYSRPHRAAVICRQIAESGCSTALKWSL